MADVETLPPRAAEAPKLAGVSPHVLLLADELQRKAMRLVAELKLGQLGIEVRAGADSLWALIRRRGPFAAVCFVLGFAFSALMDLWLWVTFWPHTWQALTVVFGQGFSFEAAHAVGNVVIALAIGPELLRLLERYSRRVRTEVVWA